MQNAKEHSCQEESILTKGNYAEPASRLLPTTHAASSATSAVSLDSGLAASTTSKSRLFFGSHRDRYTIHRYRLARVKEVASLATGSVTELTCRPRSDESIRANHRRADTTNAGGKLKPRYQGRRP